MWYEGYLGLKAWSLGLKGFLFSIWPSTSGRCHELSHNPLMLMKRPSIHVFWSPLARFQANAWKHLFNMSRLQGHKRIRNIALQKLSESRNIAKTDSITVVQ